MGPSGSPLPDTARAFVVLGPSRFEVHTFPMPVVGPDSGVLQVLIAGVDGTDVSYFRGDSARRASYPFVGGDEMVGRIAAIGTTAARRWNVEVGDLVAVEPHLACGECAWCARGDSRFCVEGRGFGVRSPSAAPPHLWGAFAEYLFLPPQATVAGLDDLTPEVGILIPSMLANGLRWVGAIGRVAAGEVVVILGAGQQALGCTVAAAELEAGEIVLSGLPGDGARLETARRLGATVTVDAAGEPLDEVVARVTRGRGADAVIDVTGSASGLETALTVVGRGGRIVVAGLSRFATTLMPDELVWNEVSILGAYSHDSRSFAHAVGLAHKRRDALSGVVSHRYPLERTDEAVASLTPPPGVERPVKVVIEPFPSP
jgi:alcohol dehydrogenase